MSQATSGLAVGDKCVARPMLPIPLVTGHAATKDAPVSNATHVTIQVIAPSGFVPVVTCSIVPGATTNPAPASPAARVALVPHIGTHPIPNSGPSAGAPVTPIRSPAGVS